MTVLLTPNHPPSRHERSREWRRAWAALATDVAARAAAAGTIAAPDEHEARWLASAEAGLVLGQAIHLCASAAHEVGTTLGATHLTRRWRLVTYDFGAGGESDLKQRFYRLGRAGVLDAFADPILGYEASIRPTPLLIATLPLHERCARDVARVRAKIDAARAASAESAGDEAA